MRVLGDSSRFVRGFAGRKGGAQGRAHKEGTLRVVFMRSVLFSPLMNLLVAGIFPLKNTLANARVCF